MDRGALGQAFRKGFERKDSKKRPAHPTHPSPTSTQLPPDPWAGCKYKKHPSQSGVL